MPPIPEGAWVTGSYVQDWSALKDGLPCVIVTKNEGIVFKLVYNQIEAGGNLLLVSTNRHYSPFEMPVNDILEVWKFETYNGFEVFSS